MFETSLLFGHLCHTKNGRNIQGASESSQRSTEVLIAACANSLVLWECIASKWDIVDVTSPVMCGLWCDIAFSNYLVTMATSLQILHWCYDSGWFGPARRVHHREDQPVTVTLKGQGEAQWYLTRQAGLSADVQNLIAVTISDVVVTPK